MKKLTGVLLLALLNVQAIAETVDMVTIKDTGEEIKFVNGYNFDRCLAFHSATNQVEKIEDAECNGLKNYNAKQAAKEQESKLRAEENRKISEEHELKRQQEIAKIEQEQAQRDQAYRKDQERIAQLKTCEATQVYRLYAVQEAVIEDIETQQNLKKAVARQKQLIKMSGVRRLNEERQIAEEQLDVQSALKEHFAEYKSAGGKAASPNAVKHKIEDPCDSFRPES
jgi:hypothetical protein